MFWDVCGSKINNDTYNFNGTIGDKQLFFWQYNFLFKKSTNNLKVFNKKTGKEILYIDSNNNLILDEVTIGDKKYIKDEIGKPILEVAQKQFDDYLKQIKEYNEEYKQNQIKSAQKEGLELLTQ